MWRNRAADGLVEIVNVALAEPVGTVTMTTGLLPDNDNGAAGWRGPLSVTLRSRCFHRPH
jgi:hypothetical protein